MDYGLGALLILASANGLASLVMPQELAEARRWAVAKFESRQEEIPPRPGLLVLANHGPVQPNARGGRPLRIAGREYRRGLYCHAVSRVLVRLPAPGATFKAIAGVDSNEQTSGGRGSVVFAVRVGEREAFRSPLIREGIAAAPVAVDLDGAAEFTLEVEDGGDGISCDQADWADARVRLADGRVLWLGDMPLAAQRAPYPTDAPFSFLYGGRPSGELLPGWRLERSARHTEEGGSEHTLIWTDPDTGLVVRCVGWLPYHECGNRDIDPYNFRSNMGPMLGLVWDSRRRDLDWKLARRLVGQWREVAPCYLGDFYPLTPYSTGEEVWMAWQFDRPDLGEGIVQAFRRSASVYESARLRLRGLDATARYRLADLDAGGAWEMSGGDLMEKGLLITVPQQPGAVVIRYRRLGGVR